MDIKPGGVLVGILGIPGIPGGFARKVDGFAHKTDGFAHKADGFAHTSDGFGSLNYYCDDNPLGRADIQGVTALRYVAAAGNIQV